MHAYAYCTMRAFTSTSPIKIGFESEITAHVYVYTVMITQLTAQV